MQKQGSRVLKRSAGNRVSEFKASAGIRVPVCLKEFRRQCWGVYKGHVRNRTGEAEAEPSKCLNNENLQTMGYEQMFIERQDGNVTSNSLTF